MRWAISSRRLAAGVGAAWLLVAGAGCEAPDPPPSIAVVTLDTLRRDHVGAYRTGGAPSPTPHLDALAAQGLLHESAYTTMPTTGPAHISAFTGLYPSQHGATKNGEPLPSQLGPRELARRLRQRGYTTAAFVTSHLAALEATGLSGFEIYDGPRGTLRTGARATEAALAWLDAERRRPVFIWLHLYDAHAPYGNNAQKGRGFPIDWDLYGWIDPARFEDPKARRRMAQRYVAGVRTADAALGRFVAGLRERVEGEPLLIVASDHGESLDEHLDDRLYGYDHGEFLDDETVVIPLVVAGPGVTPGRSAAAVSLRDIYTTVLEAAGAGDPDAERANRRDLRAASPLRRLVGIERRSFFKRQRDSVRAHAGAASDGSTLVIVGEEGSVSRGSDAPGDVVEMARERAAGATAASTRPSSAISDETRDALKSLGYAE